MNAHRPKFGNRLPVNEKAREMIDKYGLAEARHIATTNLAGHTAGTVSHEYWSLVLDRLTGRKGPKN